MKKRKEKEMGNKYKEQNILLRILSIQQIFYQAVTKNFVMVSFFLKFFISPIICSNTIFFQK